MANKFNNGEALPVEKRLEIYKKLLERYNSGEASCYIPGLCFLAKGLVREALGDIDYGIGPYIDDHPYLLPELKDFSTTGDFDSFWYEDDQERIEALEKAIKLLTTTK